MQVSAEIRWFWKGSIPDGLGKWFVGASAHSCGAGGGGSRTDRYLSLPGQTEVGIKLRGGNDAGVEVKGLVSQNVGELADEPFAGPIEIWTKWTVKGLDVGEKPLVIEKQRWLRKFDGTDEKALVEIELNDQERPVGRDRLPMRGCNVELTSIRILESGELWWTFGFESFGSVVTVESDIRSAVAEMAKRRPPSTDKGMRASYPVWLDAHVAK